MANQYTLTNDFAEIAEEKGTLYNKGDSAIELASTADTAKGAGILLLTGERRTFSGTLYARSMDAVGLLNVADFNDGGEGGEDDKTGGLPLGSVHPFLQTSIPDGWLSCENGQEVSRTAYPELWAWVQTNAPLITEAQWQTKAAAQKSVGYYSSGDGSTTFRLPRLVGFMEGVTAANVGAFTGAGLPNIVGDYAQSYIGSGQNAAAIMGAFTADATVQNADFQLNAAPGNTVFNGINFSASRSSAIYGNSNTVQPESVGMVWCVRAFGAAVNQGTVDITELAQMLNLKLSLSGGTMTGPVHFNQVGTIGGVDITYGGISLEGTDGYLELFGGSNSNNGGTIQLIGTDYAINPSWKGNVRLMARSVGTDTQLKQTDLFITPLGALSLYVATYTAEEALLTSQTTEIDSIVAKSLGLNGYIKYKSGLTFVWGRSTAGYVTFPIPFDHDFLEGMSTNISGGYNALTNGTKTGMSIVRSADVPGAEVMYFVIGY